MGSTWISKRAAVRISDDADPYVVLYEETCESNCFPRTPDWSARFFGRQSEAVRAIIIWSYYFDGGMSAGARGQSILPESNIKAWFTALDTPGSIPYSSVSLPVKVPYGDRDETVLRARIVEIKDVFTSLGCIPKIVNEDVALRCEFEFNLADKLDLAVLDKLINHPLEHPTKGSKASAWHVFDRGFSRPANPGAKPLTMLSDLAAPARLDYKVASVATHPYPGTEYVDTKHCVIDRAGNVLSGYAFHWLFKVDAWQAEFKEPRKGALSAVKTGRAKIASATELVAKDFLLMPLDAAIVASLDKYDRERYESLGLTDVPSTVDSSGLVKALSFSERNGMSIKLTPESTAKVWANEASLAQESQDALFA